MPQFTSVLFENEQQTDEILAAIEYHLRAGEPDIASQMLDFGLEALEEFGHPIANCCKAVPISSVEILGWEGIPQRLWESAKGKLEISAISIDLSQEYSPNPDGFGHFEPQIATRFYSDTAYNFSKASRAELFAAYSDEGTPWQDRFDLSDETLSIRGMDELNAEVAQLAALCSSEEGADGLTHDAYLVGSAFIAVRLHQAIKAKVEADGLPRRMAVLVGSDQVFPNFDAAVFVRDECPGPIIQLESVPPIEPPTETEREEISLNLGKAGSATELRRMLLNQQATVEAEQNQAKPKAWQYNRSSDQQPSLIKRIFSRR